MAKGYKCNPKIKKFNKSIINDKSSTAKRELAYHRKGTDKGLVAKMLGR